MIFANYNPKSIQKCAEIFCHARELFYAEIRKITEFHFWTNVMLRQPRLWALLKSSGVRG